MKEQSRRNDFTYWVIDQRIPGQTLRAVWTRVGCVAVAIVAVVGGRAQWWAWILLLLPIVAMYLAGTTARYAMTGNDPREPIAAWAAHIARKGQGLMTVNVSGLLEAAAAVYLGVLGPWVMQDQMTGWRLVAVAAAAGWFASWLGTTMLDVAWYNPLERSLPILEWIRQIAGGAAALVIAAVSVFAPWATDARLAVLALCGSLVFVQLRIAETDRTLGYGAIYAGQRELDGRRTVTTGLHTLVGNPLIHLKRRAAEVNIDLFDAVRQVEAGYRETLALDRGVDITIDWPGVLASRLEAIGGQFGVRVNFTVPDDPMLMEDREIARFVLDDLTLNAAKAGAGTISVDLTRTVGGYLVQVADDGPPFKPGTWLRPGGGLARLDRLLASRGGHLQMNASQTSKRVSAEWNLGPTSPSRSEMTQ